jgi:GH43 family beta-xylosidase
MEQKPMNGNLNDYNRPFILQRADPYILHYGNTYYFTASVPEYDRIILRQSSTLAGLASAEEVTLWSKHESGPMSKHIWAPELHFIFGKWVIYFAAGERDDIWHIRPYVLECTGSNPMADPWIEKGMMQPCTEDNFSFTSFSLDATVLMHKEEYYYIWAQKVEGDQGISNLYIAKMDSPYSLSTPAILLTTPEYDWEQVGFWVNEGPAVIRRDNKLFLTYSASATGACYCMGMLSTDIDKDLLDPASWTKETQPVLTSDFTKGIYGPGHNSFTTDEAGDTICVLHARTYETIQGDPLYDPNRHTMLMKVTWSAQGTPLFHYLLFSFI